MCYKPYMRKWISDRAKRRKKPAENKPSEPAQAPLQPAYFDAASAPPETSEERAPEPETDSGLLETPEPEESQVASLDSSQNEEVRSSQPGQARPRRRRTRGGRGRRGQRSPSRSNVPTQQPGVSAAIAAEAPPPSSEARPEPTTAPARIPKGTVVLAIGLPGSGKSSWFKRNNITPLSSDLLRQLLFDDAQEQRFQDLVFSNLRSMLKARLIARRPLNYVDATNLTPHERSNWVKLAKDYGYDVQAVFFDVPLEVCMERNRRRERAVEEDVMRRMAGKLRAPTFDEGFSKVTVVRVKKKEDQAAS
jgi:predicted kinase